MRKMRRVRTWPLVTAGVIGLVLTTTSAQTLQQRISGDAVPAPGGSRNEKPGMTLEQMERLEARIATATAIVSRLEREAKARGLGGGWRQASLATLLSLSLERLRQVEQQAFDLDAISSTAKTAVDDPHTLGDPQLDLVYTPISPCRYIDTRNAGGKITGVRGFDADVAGPTYGGDSGCDPTAKFGVATSNLIGALAMNVTVVDTSAAPPPGFVAVKPMAASPVTSLLNWYDQGASVQVANQGIVSLRQDQGPHDDFVIQTSGAVHAIVDIFGAFIAPQATELNRTFTTADIQVANLAAGMLETPLCLAGYTLTGGGCLTEHFGHYLWVTAVGLGGGSWAAGPTTPVESPRASAPSRSVRGCRVANEVPIGLCHACSIRIRTSACLIASKSTPRARVGSAARNERHVLPPSVFSE